MSKNNQRTKPFYVSQTSTATEEPVDIVTDDATQEETVVTEQIEVKVEPVPVPTQTPTQAPTVAPSPLPIQIQQTSTQQGNNLVKSTQVDLISYIEAMDPKKPINPKEGGRWQYSLFTIIRNTLNTDDQELFNQLWNSILIEAYKQKDAVFSENFVFRFPAEWPGTSNEYTSFRRLITLINMSANPQTRRQEVANLNIQKVTEFLTQAQHAKIVNFYGV